MVDRYWWVMRVDQLMSCFSYDRCIRVFSKLDFPKVNLVEESFNRLIMRFKRKEQSEIGGNVIR